MKNEKMHFSYLNSLIVTANLPATLHIFHHLGLSCSPVDITPLQLTFDHC